jgi:hypothetical protein
LQIGSELSDDSADYFVEQFGGASVDEAFADDFGLFNEFAFGVFVDVFSEEFYFIGGEALEAGMGADVVCEGLFPAAFAADF